MSSEFGDDPEEVTMQASRFAIKGKRTPYVLYRHQEHLVICSVKVVM
jgi:hypothetical protein